MNRIEDYLELETISLMVQRYANTNKIKSLVVGVSGGIDSAVVASLCAETGIPTYVVCPCLCIQRLIVTDSLMITQRH